MSQGEALPGSAHGHDCSTSLLRTLAQLGPEPADHAGRHGRPSPATAPAPRRRRRSAATAPSPASPSPTPAAATRRATVNITGAGHRRHGDRDGHQQRRRHRRQRHGATAPATRRPSSTISGGGATTDATATAYGGVDAHHRCRTPAPATSSRPSTSTCRTTRTARRPRLTPIMDANGAITGDRHRQPRLRLRHRARTSSIRDGTLIDPIANAGAGASATATINVTSVDARHVRRRLHLRPDGDDHRRRRHRQRRHRHRDGRRRRRHRASTSPPPAPATSPAAASASSSDQLPGLCNPAVAGSCPDWQPTRRQVHPARRARGEDLQRPQRPADQGRRVRDRRSCSTAPSSAATCRPRWCAATCSSRRPANAAISQHYPLTNELLERHQRSPVLINGAAGLRRHAAAVARPDHRGHQEQAGPRRLPQPAADRRRRRPLPAGRQHPDGLGHGPHGPARPGRRGHRHGRGAQPGLHRVRPSPPTASRTTAPPCTSTAAPPRGSATARRTSGSRRPTRTRRGRRA